MQWICVPSIEPLANYLDQCIKYILGPYRVQLCAIALSGMFIEQVS